MILPPVIIAAQVPQITEVLILPATAILAHQIAEALILPVAMIPAHQIVEAQILLTAAILAHQITTGVMRIAVLQVHLLP